MNQFGHIKITEEEAKKQIEEKLNIEFIYRTAEYDEKLGKWKFEFHPENSKSFLTLCGIKDFLPYSTLAKNLNINFSEVLDKYVWFNYGDEYEFDIARGLYQYCWTGKGWLSLKDIEAKFKEQFGDQRKNYHMKNENWVVSIFSNACYSETYKPHPKAGWPTAEKVELLFDSLKELLIYPEIIEEEVIAPNMTTPTEQEKPHTPEITTKEQEEVEKIIQDDTKNTPEDSEIKGQEEEPEIYTEKNEDTDTQFEEDKKIEQKDNSQIKNKEKYTKENFDRSINESDSNETTPELEENIQDAPIEEPNSEYQSSPANDQSSNPTIDNNTTVEPPPVTKKKMQTKKSKILFSFFALLLVIFGIYKYVDSQKYTVYFDLNGGTKIRYKRLTQKAYFGADIILPTGEDLINKNLIFKGWNTRSDGAGDTYEENSSHIFDQNITLYAVWDTPDKYTPAYVHIKGLRMRSGPSTDYKILLLLPQDAEIEVSDKDSSGNWVKISYNNQIGFVNKTYLRDFKITDLKIGSQKYSGSWIIQPCKSMRADMVYYMMIWPTIESFSKLNNVEFKIKIISPYGELQTWNGAPRGYTLKTINNIKDMKDSYNFSGFGNDYGTAYYSGRWKVQIWYANPNNPRNTNACIASYIFTLK